MVIHFPEISNPGMFPTVCNHKIQGIWPCNSENVGFQKWWFLRYFWIIFIYFTTLFLLYALVEESISGWHTTVYSSTSVEPERDLSAASPPVHSLRQNIGLISCRRQKENVSNICCRHKRAPATSRRIVFCRFWRSTSDCKRYRGQPRTPNRLERDRQTTTRVWLIEWMSLFCSAQEQQQLYKMYSGQDSKTSLKH